MKLYSGQEAFPGQKNVRRGPCSAAPLFLGCSVPASVTTPHMISSGIAGPTPRRDHNQGQHKPPTPLPTHPAHNLKPHTRPHTTSRSQPGATQAPNTPTHTPHTQSQAAHQTSHHVEITIRGAALPTPYRDAQLIARQGPKHHCPHPRRTTAPQQPDNAFPPHTPTPPAHNRKPHTRDTHPRRTTAPLQPDIAFLHTRQYPAHNTNPRTGHPPAPATTQTPGQANPPAPTHNTRPHTPALHGRG